MSFNKYKNLVTKDPDGSTLASADAKLKVGCLQIWAWAARHVSEEAILNPGVPSKAVDASRRIVAGTG